MYEQGITSTYMAYPPDDREPRIARITNDAKRKYEAKGWRFKRATMDWDPK